jgi:hypothetical protein
MSRGRVPMPEMGWTGVSADASVPATPETPNPIPASALVPKTRSRLFIKYVVLFVAVVCVALLANGIF